MLLTRAQPEQLRLQFPHLGFGGIGPGSLLFSASRFGLGPGLFRLR